MSTRFVPGNLFELVGIEGQGHRFHSTAQARARRLLVTMAVLHPDWSVAAPKGLATAARLPWEVDQRALRHPGPVSVFTALLKLRAMGFLTSVEPCDGGYQVALAEAVAA